MIVCTIKLSISGIMIFITQIIKYQHPMDTLLRRTLVISYRRSGQPIVGLMPPRLLDYHEQSPAHSLGQYPTPSRTSK